MRGNRKAAATVLEAYHGRSNRRRWDVTPGAHTGLAPSQFIRQNTHPGKRARLIRRGKFFDHIAGQSVVGSAAAFTRARTKPPRPVRRGHFFDFPPLTQAQINPSYVPDVLSHRRPKVKQPRRGHIDPILPLPFFNTTCQQNVLVDAPTGFWPLVYNQVSTGTNEVDYSGGQKNLTWTLAPPATQFVDNAGVNLAGDREAQRVSEPWEQATSWTLEWWMQSTGTGAGFMAVVSRRAGTDCWAVYIDRTNGRIQLDWQNQGGVVPTVKTSSGVNLLDGSLHHCVVEVAWDGVTTTTYAMYVDTVNVGSGNLFLGGTPPISPEPFRLCGENGSRQFIGKIANVAFYNYALSTTRIISHFQCIQGTWNPTTIIVRYPRRFPGRRNSKRIEPPWPQAAAPAAPSYPYELIRARQRAKRRVPRGRYWSFVPNQETVPNPAIVLALTRGRLRRGFIPRRGHFWWLNYGATVPGGDHVVEPIQGFLVTDGRTTGILVSDGATTGLLVTDGHTYTVIVT